MRKQNVVTVLAPAKLNLALDVVGLLPNGYHDLDMTMQAITLYERVVLRRRVDMGNERRPAEVRLFQMLFSQGDVCEGVSLLYKRTAEKADEVLRRYWVRRMYRKTSGNPLIMRALGILAGALTAAEAASPILPSGFVRWLLLAVIFVLGGVLFAVIQYAPAAYYQGKWPLAGLAAACAAALLAMAQLGEGVGSGDAVDIGVAVAGNIDGFHEKPPYARGNSIP